MADKNSPSHRAALFHSLCHKTDRKSRFDKDLCIYCGTRKNSVFSLFRYMPFFVPALELHNDRDRTFVQQCLHLPYNTDSRQSLLHHYRCRSFLRPVLFLFLPYHRLWLSVYRFLWQYLGSRHLCLLLNPALLPFRSPAFPVVPVWSDFLLHPPSALFLLNAPMSRWHWKNAAWSLPLIFHNLPFLLPYRHGFSPILNSGIPYHLIR